MGNFNLSQGQKVRAQCLYNQAFPKGNSTLWYFGNGVYLLPKVKILVHYLKYLLT